MVFSANIPGAHEILEQQGPGNTSEEEVIATHHTRHSSFLKSHEETCSSIGRELSGDIAQAHQPLHPDRMRPAPQLRVGLWGQGLSSQTLSNDSSETGRASEQQRRQLKGHSHISSVPPQGARPQSSHTGSLTHRTQRRIPSETQFLLRINL